MPPSNVNDSERAVWEWLVNGEGVDPDDIERGDKDQVPDFETPDAAYEAKSPVADAKIIISPRQKRILDREDPTIVVMSGHEDEPRETFQWSERGDSEYLCHQYSRSKTLTMYCSEDEYRRFREVHSEIAPGGDQVDTVMHLLDVYERHGGEGGPGVDFR